MSLFNKVSERFGEEDESKPLTSKLDKMKSNRIVACFLKAKSWYQSERFRKLRRWAALIVGSVMMIAAGTQYAFSSISPSIKQQFHLTQYEVNLIGTATNIGATTGILFSLINDFIGPRVCSLAAGLVLFGSYFIMSLTVSGAIPEAGNASAMSAFMFLVGNSSGGAYIAALTTSVKNFPEKDRGLVVGLLSSFFGISSAIFSLCFSVIFMQSLPAYMFFCSIFGAVAVLILGTLFLDNNSSAEKKEMTTTVMKPEESNIETVSINNGNLKDQMSGLIEEEKEEGLQVLSEEEIKEKLAQDQIENINTWRMLISLDFWLIFLIIFLSIGSGITIVNNLGSIVLAYGGHNGQQTPIVISFSISNCLGRLIFGWLSDKFFSPRRGITRMFFLAICIIIMSISILLFAFVPIPGFYPLIIITGLCYGGILSVGPTYNSERFGPKYFGLNSTVQLIATSLGSYAFSTGLAGSIYEMNIIPPRTRTCHGKECYLLTFYILSGLCVVALLLSLVLHRRSLALYFKIGRRRKYLAMLEKINIEKRKQQVA